MIVFLFVTAAFGALSADIRVNDRQAFIRKFKESKFEDLLSNQKYNSPTYSVDKSKRIGHGSSCSVYKGRFENLQLVAAKQINIYEYKDDDDDDTNDGSGCGFSNGGDEDEEKKRKKNDDKFKGLQQEVRLLSVLSHENIIKLRDTFSDAAAVKSSKRKECMIKKYYLFYDFMELGSLEQFSCLSETKPFELKDYRRRGLMKGVLSALVYLHSLNIIHRDIKPANIMLTGDYEARLIDFGLATEPTIKPVRVKGACGTPIFFAPEMIRNSSNCRGYGVKVDIWAFGLTLWSLYTDPMPGVDSLSMEDLFDRISEKGPWGELPNGDPEVIDVIKWCVERGEATRASAINLLELSYFNSK